MIVDSNTKEKTKYILDTAFFIQLKNFDNENCLYYTTKFIIDEIRDEKAREHYELNKSFVNIVNPSDESVKFITSFSKKSNDLFNLSIPDLSVLAITYEMSNKENLKTNCLRLEPQDYIVLKRKKKEVIKEEEEIDEDGFVTVKNNKKSVEENDNYETLWGDNDDDWINESNLDKKLSKFTSYEEKVNNNKDDPEKIIIDTYIITNDFTIQNVCLKMGLGVLSVNGLQIKAVKYFLFKCYSCNTFDFDTTIQFCKNCGYTTLMKIGYKVNEKGEVLVFDKEADLRKRGTQYDLPKPTLSKKDTIYILCEDQIPSLKKEKEDLNIDNILEKFTQYKSLQNNNKKHDFEGVSSKKLVWGYPKSNPNIPKKYYGKKSKK